MNALLISALFATLSVSNEIAAPTDTINRYVIDGHTITAFDGSQLVSKTIVKYDISYKNSTEGVIKEHNIKTDNHPQEAIISGTSGHGSTSGFSIREYQAALPDGAKPLLIVDDKEFNGSIEDIDPETVRSMTVLKGKAAETVWGEKGKNGVIEIKTKK